jgi:hypothetical protein
VSVFAAFEEALVWAGRAIRLVPAIRQLWEAISESNGDAELAAQLELVRQIRTQQALEEFRGGP